MMPIKQIDILKDLDRHGFLWVGEIEKPILDELVMQGMCVDCGEWDRGHKMYCYDITLKGLEFCKSITKVQR